MGDEPDGWRKHEKHTRSTSQTNTVTVYSGRDMNIHSAEWNRYADGAMWVDVYFRPAGDELGVMPVQEPGPDSYSVRDNGVFKCTSILSRLGITDHDETTQLDAGWIGDMGMWSVDVTPLREDG